MAALEKHRRRFEWLGWVDRRQSAFPALLLRSGPAAFGQTASCRNAVTRRTGRSARRPLSPSSVAPRDPGSGRQSLPTLLWSRRARRFGHCSPSATISWISTICERHFALCGGSNALGAGTSPRPAPDLVWQFARRHCTRGSRLSASARSRCRVPTCRWRVAANSRRERRRRSTVARRARRA